ncbi:hypothetical protein OMCYN_01650 [cyanobiont of Ornithocercus magnificus]|nr:hypothetical protein OMCYN_01650 [cyanobiont of Ornithocercus magnificus]
MTASPAAFSEITTATAADALYLAKNLLPADRDELVAGYGVDPVVVLPKAIASSAGSYWCLQIGYRAAAIAAIENDGLIWMLSSVIASDHPVILARQAKRFLADRRPSKLWNWADLRNRAHLRLISWLGFHFGQVVPFGPRRLPFIYFEKCFTPPH